jgi:peptidoglycan/xylan/chitin deacetylase (PgdA/CDA1 family)
VRTKDLPLQAVKLALLSYGAVARDRRPGIIVLVYHRVGGTSDRQIDLPVELFDWQMRYLRERYRVISLDQAVAIAEESRAPREETVAITFDDGYEDIHRNAFPILRKYALPATIYLATAYIENGQHFPFEARLAQEKRGRPLTWAQAAEMAASGLVTFGSHTHTHADLSILTVSKVLREVERSNALITERISRPPAHFSYPWGKWSPGARQVVRESYRTVAIGGTRVNPYGGIDLHALRRVPIQRSDGRFFFRLKLGSYLVGEEWFRSPIGAAAFPPRLATRAEEAE